MLIKPIRVLSDQVNEIIQLSRQYHATLYPPESINQDNPHDLINDSMYFIGAYRDDPYSVFMEKVIE